MGRIKSNSGQISEQRMEEGIFSHLLGRETVMDVMDRAAHTHCDLIAEVSVHIGLGWDWLRCWWRPST